MIYIYIYKCVFVIYIYIYSIYIPIVPSFTILCAWESQSIRGSLASHGGEKTKSVPMGKPWAKTTHGRYHIFNIYIYIYQNDV